jgi:ferredoxin
MTYAITAECISCQRCLSACPTEAIQTDGTAFWIAINRCNQCEGSHGVPQCWAVCPTNAGCVPLTSGALTASTAANTDYWETWFSTYTRLVNRLKSSQPSTYWRHWFNTYAHHLQNLQTPAPSEP